MRAGTRRARKLVYAASSSCYGLADVPTREDAPIQPEYPYALSKYMGEEAVLHWGRVYRLPVNSIRIFNAYGTRSKTRELTARCSAFFSRRKLRASRSLLSATGRSGAIFFSSPMWRAPFFWRPRPSA